ncbi:hypothetical protein CIB84_010999 [Bambusicola thoracicus]|uniref:Uncharacterized protein n=1 Tax=Bambusicola thoracicus TaxID=9083 RepID=A0A2P4SMB3_BAMTH|nr:hypothetical protein CIB84_010999 [Bambusicola thoracicus]
MASNGVFDSFAAYSSTFLRVVVKEYRQNLELIMARKTHVLSKGSADGWVGLNLNRMGQGDPKPVPTEGAEQQML